MEKQPNPRSAWRQILSFPEAPRVLPFFLFLLIGSAQGKFFSGSEYWFYAIKTIAIGGLLWSWKRMIPEMRWAFSIEGLAVGLGIAALWIGLEHHVLSLEEIWNLARKLVTGQVSEPPKAEPPWNPVAFFAGAPILGWGFVAVRVLGRSLVVPAMEEVFYRSFLYRYVANPKFIDVPLGVWHSVAFAVTCGLFSFSHPNQWLAALICAAAYQWLVIRKQRLGDAILAHATTNLAISIWAISTNRWEFT
jgi:hypothetical protein